MSDLIEMWHIAVRVTRFVLDGVPPEALADKLEPRGWSVGQHFAHLHNNRWDWLSGYPDFQKRLDKVPKEQANDKAALQTALDQSAQVMADMLARAVEKGKVSGITRSPAPAVFVGYMIAHELYHHGEIGVILAQNGHRLPKEVAWGMWEWDKR